MTEHEKHAPACAFLLLDSQLRRYVTWLWVGGATTLLAGAGTFATLWFGQMDVAGPFHEFISRKGDGWLTALMPILVGLLVFVIFTLAFWFDFGLKYRGYFNFQNRCRGHLHDLENDYCDTCGKIVILSKEIETRNSEEKVLLAGIREIGRQFHHLARISGDVICSLTETGRIEFASETVADILLYRTPEVRGRTLDEFLPAQDRKELVAFLQQVAQGGDQVFTREIQMVRKDGQAVDIFFTATSMGKEDDKALLLLGILQEITSKKQIERQLQENVHLLLEDGDKPAFLTTTATMDGILGSQLTDVIAETEKAANRISGFAHDLDTSMTDLLRVLSTANERTSELGKSSQKIIDEDQQAIQDLKNFIAQAEERQQEGQERVRTAMDQVRGLQRLVKIVLEVSEHTTVLALNASIVAARAGEHGHKFNVVANEVKKLAQQTREVAKQIEEGITHAAATVEEVLSNRMNKDQAQNEDDMLRKSAEQMSRLGDHYRNLISFNEVTMRQMSEWNVGMSDRVIMLVGGIQFQDIVRQRVEQVINALNRRKAHADAIVERLRNPGKVIAIEQLSVEDLFQDYVMEDQRRSHERATGGKSGQSTSAPPMVELF